MDKKLVHLTTYYLSILKQLAVFQCARFRLKMGGWFQIAHELSQL